MIETLVILGLVLFCALALGGFIAAGIIVLIKRRASESTGRSARSLGITSNFFTSLIAGFAGLIVGAFVGYWMGFYLGILLAYLTISPSSEELDGAMTVIGSSIFFALTGATSGVIVGAYASKNSHQS